MARLLLNTSARTTRAPTSLDSRASLASKAQLSPAALEARLRQPRGAAYLAALTQIDSGGHVCGTAAVQSLLSALREEFPDLSIENYPVGIVAQCFLGAPFEVHTFNFGAQVQPSNVVRHYKTFESLPAPLEAARALALNPAYAFVEVYTDKLVPVAPNHTVSILSLLGGASY